jgi:CBF1 interacting corepressor
LNLKGFHPSNKANQRRLFIAEEREKDRIKRDAEAMKEWEAEQEMYQTKQPASQNNVNQSIQSVEKLKARKQQLLGHTSTFDEPIPVVKMEEEGEKKKKRKRGGGRGGGNKQKESKHPLSLMGAVEEAEKAEELRIQQELSDLDRRSSMRRGQEEKLNFMYTVPPGLKAAMEREKEEEEKQRIREKLLVDHVITMEEQMSLIPKQQDQSFYPQPIKLVGNAQPIAVLDPENRSKPKHLISDADKFPILKNAPVAGRYTENVKLKHKPLGVELRDVRCTRCGGFGHTNLDRECPMRHFNPLDKKRQQMEDPMAKFIENETEPVQKEEPKEDDNEQILKQLTPDERKKLLKKYNELRKKLKLESESESEDEERRRKRKKEKKEKREKKRKHESSGDERDHKRRKTSRHDDDRDRYDRRDREYDRRRDYSDDEDSRRERRSDRYDNRDRRGDRYESRDGYSATRRNEEKHNYGDRR